MNRTHKSASVVPRLSEFSYDHAFPTREGWYATHRHDDGGNIEYYEVVPFEALDGSLRMMAEIEGEFESCPEERARKLGFTFGPMLFQFERGFVDGT